MLPKRASETVQKRTRASTRRSKTGCSTCRIRRIKCDEVRPSCGQCTRGRRKCDGYAKQPQDYRENAAPIIPSPLQTLRINQSLPNMTSNERRSFDFFCRHTVRQLCGLFDSGFWEYLVLQTSHHELAILHAAIALGSVHESFETGMLTSSPYPQFALEQYVKSIRMISRPNQTQDKPKTDITLMTCILFICIEMISGHNGTAIAHIESGAKILREEQQKNQNHPISSSSATTSSFRYVPLSTLSLLFARLDLQASQILSKRPLYFRQGSAEKDSGFHSDIPSSFLNLEQARNAMDYLRNCVMRSLEKITQADEIFKPSVEGFDTDRKKCASRLQQWSAAFETFLRNQGGELDGDHQQGVHLLKIQKIMTAMNLDLEDLNVKWTETAYDSYMLEFEAILSHVLSIVKGPKKQPFKFSLEPSVVPVLFFVASKCRHPIIRRKAISLLSMAPRREGVWDSAPIVRVLKRYIEIEEDGLTQLTDAADIPDFNRLSGVDSKFDLEGRRAWVQYQRIWGPGTITKRDFQECIEW